MNHMQQWEASSSCTQLCLCVGVWVNVKIAHHSLGSVLKHFSRQIKMHACARPHLHPWTMPVFSYANDKRESWDEWGLVIPGDLIQLFRLGWVRAPALEAAKVSAVFDSNTSPSSSSRCTPAQRRGSGEVSSGRRRGQREQKRCMPRVRVCVCAQKGSTEFKAGITEDQEALESVR